MKRRSAGGERYDIAGGTDAPPPATVEGRWKRVLWSVVWCVLVCEVAIIVAYRLR